jgi:hypothetical protein
MPYGWDHDGISPKPVPNEQCVLMIIRKARAFGDSYREIAHALNEDGYRTREGEKFRAGDIVHLAGLADEVYWKRYGKRKRKE